MGKDCILKNFLKNPNMKIIQNHRWEQQIGGLSITLNRAFAMLSPKV